MLLTNPIGYYRTVHYMKYDIPDTEIKYHHVALNLDNTRTWNRQRTVLKYDDLDNLIAKSCLMCMCAQVLTTMKSETINEARN